MRATILDTEALKAVSPAALSAYARAEGWIKDEPYGDHSDVYVAHGRPEIILPRTQRLGDYASVVSRLVEIFADAAETDELSMYRNLVTVDRDVVRVRAGEASDGTIAVADGLALLSGAHDMVLAAACSLWNPRPRYRLRSNRKAVNHVQGFHLGQTEQGSFTVTLLSPVVKQPMQRLILEDDLEDDPVERRITKRLTGALTTVRAVTERPVIGDGEVLFEMVEEGVSANLCEALVTLIKPFPTLDVSVTWARTLPRQTALETVRFSKDDAPILRKLERSFPNQELPQDVKLTGTVQRLNRGAVEATGNISLKTSVDGQNRSVEARLESSDYRQAIQAHQAKASVVMEGDLERSRQRLRLRNARVVDVISNDDEADDG